MSYVTPAEMKRFLNLPAFDASTAAEDNILLQSLIDSAEVVIANHIMREWSELEDASTGTITADLKLAIMTLASTWYVNRESVSFGQPYRIPYTLEFVLQPYKKYTRTIDSSI